PENENLLFDTGASWRRWPPEGAARRAVSTHWRGAEFSRRVRAREISWRLHRQAARHEIVVARRKNRGREVRAGRVVRLPQAKDYIGGGASLFSPAAHSRRGR